MNSYFEKILLRLGKSIKDDIVSSKIPYENIQEMRLNINHSAELVTKEKSFFISERKFSKSDIQNIFASLCEYSVHTYINEICEGFITVEGGFRVGICGTAVYDNGKIINIKDISGLNIRIPHEYFGTADALIPHLEHGLLLVGPPCCGKTTMLRELARQASKYNHVVIVDERTEISGTYRGLPSFDVGNSMVLNGFLKSDGIIIAARTMAPEYIICDEFGSEKDILSALYAMKSGVNIIASIHAFDKDDLLTKPRIKTMLEQNIFRYIAFLNKKFEIYEIINSGDLS